MTRVLRDESKATVSLSQRIGVGNRVRSSDSIPLDMQESVFMIKASHSFLEVLSGGKTLPASYVSERDQMATYRAAAAAGGDANTPGLQLSFKVKPTLNQTVFNTFGDASGIITTVVVVTGLLTGIQHHITLPLKYSNDTI